MLTFVSTLLLELYVQVYVGRVVVVGSHVAQVVEAELEVVEFAAKVIAVQVVSTLEYGHRTTSS